MKLYLSSYKVGEKAGTLKQWLSTTQKRVGYVANALDSFKKKDPDWLEIFKEEDKTELRELGFEVEELDLKNYFGKKASLAQRLRNLDMLWISGGNTFVLRQAMKLSGFDELISDLRERTDFVYGGYSAACCVLSPSLKGLDIVDDSNEFIYELKEPIWEGLGLIDYAFLPHYDSDHPESADIAKEVDYCKKNNIPYKTVRDGQVILVD